MVAASLGCGGRAVDAPPPLPPGVQPNVVWIVLDAARAENFTWHGYERETTPFIDELTQQGAAFHRHYAQAPATLYSVSSYLSGRYFATSYHDDVGMQAAFRVRPDEERLVSEIGSRNGYYTAAFSTSPWFYETSHLAKTFDEFVVCRAGGGAMEPLDAMAERVETWLDNKPDQPFLLYVHAMDTHFPHAVNEDVARWYPENVPEHRAAALRGGKARPPFDEQDREYLRALYDGGLRQADAAVEKLCRALKDAGEWDRTILVISSDHGELLGEDGRTLQHPIRETQHALYHTPLIIRAPGVTAGMRVDTITENVDILPTIADLASWQFDAEFDGASLQPLWSGGGDSTRRPFAIARAMCFASLGKPTVVLFDETHGYVHPLCGGEDSVHLIRDKSNAPTNQQRKMAQAFLADHVLPKWGTFEALPQTAPPVQQRPFPGRAKPATAYTSAHVAEDGKWALDGGVLREGGAVEDVPAIHMTVPVHAGEYRVVIEADARTGSDRSLQFREEREKDSRTVPISENGDAVVGEYNIGADVFRFAIDDVPDSEPLALHAIRFQRPDTDDAVVPAAERLELLKSLGYVD